MENCSNADILLAVGKVRPITCYFVVYLSSVTNVYAIADFAGEDECTIEGS